METEMRWLSLLGLVAVLSGCTSSRKPAVPATSNDLPVASATLYASGVAFVEHQGKVTDDALFSLRSKASDVPGILKSLVVYDQADSRSFIVLPGAEKTDEAPDNSTDDDDAPSANATPSKPLAVKLQGKGERAVRVGYALEAKPWKVTYRLMLGQTPSLQAWATIANDTDYDWKKIQLNLVSGRPLVSASGAEAAAKGAGVAAGESLLRPRLIPSRQAIDLPPESAQPPAPIEAVPPAALPTTMPLVNPREAFRYSVADISVPRGGTVVVPVLEDAVAVERVAAYNERTLGRNPLQGARIRNTTAHYLLQGSVAVLDEGEFVGDASLENLAPGRDGLVTWGIDLPVLVDSTHEALRESVKSARIEKGVAHVTRGHEYARRYTVENEDQKDRAIIIEHPMRRGWSLADSTLLVESTETLYRFRLTAPAGKRASLLVKEQTSEVEDIELALADVESILALSREGSVVPAVREALGRAAAQKEGLAEQERQIRAKEADLERLVSEEAKTRQTLQGLSEQSPARTRLQEKLDKSEAQIADLTKTIDQAQEALEKAAAQVRADLGKLDAGE
jgi:hypothetical protein